MLLQQAAALCAQTIYIHTQVSISLCPAKATLYIYPAIYAERSGFLISDSLARVV